MTKIVIYIGMLVLIGFVFVAKSALMSPVESAAAGVVFGIAVAIVYAMLLKYDLERQR